MIADGSVTWTYCGEGTASGVSAVESVEAGPYAAATGTLTVIDTPITGWLSVRNLADVKVGAYLETDAALRIRRENEITGNANGTLDAIRAKLLRVGQGGANPVLDCVVLKTRRWSSASTDFRPSRSRRSCWVATIKRCSIRFSQRRTRASSRTVTPLVAQTTAPDFRTSSSSRDRRKSWCGLSLT